MGTWNCLRFVIHDLYVHSVFYGLRALCFWSDNVGESKMDIFATFYLQFANLKHEFILSVSQYNCSRCKRMDLLDLVIWKKKVFIFQTNICYLAVEFSLLINTLNMHAHYL